MSQFYDLLNAGLAAVKTQAPCTVVFNGRTFTGISSPIQTRKRTQEQGFLDDADGMFILTQDEITTAGIADGSTGAVDGQSVRVVGILLDGSDGPEVTFKHSR